MPKPNSKAHMSVAYDFVEYKMNARYLNDIGKRSKISKRYIKKIANRGDRKASRLECKRYLMMVA